MYEARAQTSRSLDYLLKAVEAIETARLGDHVSISGELFPKISDDRKQAAAFYTTPAAAELLTSLLIRKKDGHDWQDPKLFCSLRIADLACGTGTLLRAAYRRVRTLHESVGGISESDSRVAHERDGIRYQGCRCEPHCGAPYQQAVWHWQAAEDPYGKTSIGWVSVGEPADAPLDNGFFGVPQKQQFD